MHLRKKILKEVKRSLSLKVMDGIASNMNGEVVHHHMHILYDLRTLLGEKVINYLEIGTFHGGQTALMLLHPYETNIYCIDPKLDDNALKNFKKFNIYDRKIELFAAGSHNFIDIFGKVLEHKLTFDIIFIANKSKCNEVISAFINYYSLLNEGGYVIFDQYENQKLEVKKAVDNIIFGICKNAFLGYFNILENIPNLKQAKPIDMVKNNCFLIYRPNFTSNLQFAVVIATYQRPSGKTKSYLQRAFECLRNQKYQNFKVFLIGDRYEDHEEFLSFRKELSANKIYLENLKVAHERDNCKRKRNLWTIGGANAMNHGLRQARKEGFRYMAHLDDDDIWHPNHLRNLAMAYCQFSNIAFACNKGILNSDILPYVNIYSPGNFLPKGNDCFHSTYSFRLDIIPFEYQTIDLMKEEVDYEPADLVMLRNIGRFITESSKSKIQWSSICVPHITCFREKEHETV